MSRREERERSKGKVRTNAPKGISDWYKILTLDLGEALTTEKLKSAYKTQCRKWHPDVWSTDLGLSREDGENRFKEVQRAYEELGRYLSLGKDGQVPANVVDAKAFFRQMGLDDLADLTAETLIEISLERASLGLGAEARGEATAGQAAAMIDAQIMEKMKLLARGPEYESIEIFDADGHFKDKAIRNILEYAVVYENADTRAERRRFLIFEVNGTTVDPLTVRIATIIRSWVEEHYVHTNKGYVHRSKVAYWRTKVAGEIVRTLSELRLSEESVSAIQIAVTKGRYGEAEAELSALRSATTTEMGRDTPYDAREATRLEKEISKIDAELDRLADRLKMNVEALVEAARGGPKSKDPALRLIIPRIKVLSESRSMAQAFVAGARSEASSRLIILDSLIDDVRDLADKAS